MITRSRKKNIRFLFIVLAVMFSWTESTSAQDLLLVKKIGIGPEMQVYPTGLIPGLVCYYRIDENSWAHFRSGVQIIRHGSAGIHQDERGQGWGVSLGYDHRLKLLGSNWLAGLRSDLWKNKINWRDHIDTTEEISGVSRVTVVQPTLRLSYPIDLKSSVLLPSISFGTEINVHTVGEETGQGLILLIGLACIFR